MEVLESMLSKYEVAVDEYLNDNDIKNTPNHLGRIDKSYLSLSVSERNFIDETYERVAKESYQQPIMGKQS